MPRNINSVWDKLMEEHGDTSVGESHWILMTKDVIPGTMSKRYSDQCDLLQKRGVDFNAPHLLDATTTILMHYVATGTRLYSDAPWTYTRCQEKVGGNQTVSGGFSGVGLGLDFCDFTNIGLACCWRF